MSEDFFADFSRCVTKHGKKAAEKMDAAIESAKIRTQMMEEQSDMEDNYRALGEEVYQQAADDPSSAPKAVVLTDEARTLIGSIARHKFRYNEMRDRYAKSRGCVVCPSCGALIGKESAFCPSCGAKMPEGENADAAPDGDAPEQTETKTDGTIPID